MKNQAYNNFVEKRHYEAPIAKIIEIEGQGVLCSSAFEGNSTENVQRQYFGFP